MIVVERTAPLLTVQDRGRFGFLADGVTRSGGLDALALAVGNALVGNLETAAALEGCLGGAALRFDVPATFALTGADVVARLAGEPIATYAAIEAKSGDTLDIERIALGAVWYLAVRGGIDVPVVLESRSTLLSAGFGGLDGQPVKTRATLPIGTLGTAGAVRAPVPVALRASLDAAPIALCTAPRSDALDEAGWQAFYARTFSVSRAVSRVGYRLEGEPVRSRLPADIASEPACGGAMQLPPEGQPIVLMADHPTIGGYPIIGVVPSCALGALAQRAPGREVRFTQLSGDRARDRAKSTRKTLSQWLSLG